MSKTKLKRIIPIVVLVLFIFSSLPSALAYRHGKNRSNINYRPIEHWLDQNPYGCGPYYWTAFFGPDWSGHNYWVWFDGVTEGMMGWEYNYEYSGYVREKLLSDGSLEFKVVLKVKDMYVEYLNGIIDEFGDPWYYDLVMGGYMDYVFQLTFTLDAYYPGVPPFIPEGTREPGCTLPFFEGILRFPEELGIHVQSFLLLGVGSGDYYEPGWTYDMWVEDDPSTWPVLTGETGKIYEFHYATFDDGEYLELPFGFYGFRYSFICLK